MDLHKHLRELRLQEEELKSRIKKGERLIKEQKKAADDLLYTPRIEEAIYQASDYAGMSCGEYSFYYGYEELETHPLFESQKEEDERKTWAFTVADKDGKIVYRKAIYGEHVGWDCVRGIVVGIGYWLEDNPNLKQGAK